MAKKDADVKYVSDTDENRKLVDEFISLSAAFKKYEDAIKAMKGQLHMASIDDFFAMNSGKHEPVTSVVVKGSDGNEVTVSFTAKYSELNKDDEGLVSSIIGESRLEQLFFERLSVKFDQKGIDSLTAKKAKQFRAELEEIGSMFGIETTVTQALMPKAEYHKLRHIEFDVEENLVLEEVEPCVKSVKISKSNPLSGETAKAINADIERYKGIETTADVVKKRRTTLMETRIASVKSKHAKEVL